MPWLLPGLGFGLLGIATVGLMLSRILSATWRSRWAPVSPFHASARVCISTDNADMDVGCCVSRNACIMLFLQASVHHSCNHCRQRRDPAGVPQPGRAVHAVLVPAQCSRGDRIRMGCSPVSWGEISPPLLVPERWRAGGLGLRNRPAFRDSGASTAGPIAAAALSCPDLDTGQKWPLITTQ